ncbi:MAG: AAA family ATPase [Bacillota bacterium]|nr:AAA family ATPase [Bacillota bacterium]
MGIEKRIHLILITFLVVEFAFFLNDYLPIPRYEAKATLVMGSMGEDSHPELQANKPDSRENVVNTCIYILNSSLVQDQVTANLKLNMQSKNLSQAVTVRARENTSILEILVTDTDPQMAADIANEYLAVFLKTLDAKTKLHGVKVLEYSAVPTMPVSLYTTRNIILVAAIGLFLGLVFVILLEWKEMYIYSADELAANMTYSLLGLIAAQKEGKQGPDAVSLPGGKRLESLNVLRSNLMNIVCREKLKTIAVVPATKEEHHLSDEIAHRYALTDARVLLIDCDMRKYLVNSRISNKKHTSLFRVLNGELDFGSIVTGKSLDHLISDRQAFNASELLAGHSMKRLMDFVRTRYDVIFLDTPPVSEFTDAAALQPLVDAYVITATEGRVTKRQLQESLQALENVDANIIGIVMSAAE